MGFFRKKKQEADNPYAQSDPYANPMTPYQHARHNMQNGLHATGESPSSSASNAPPPPYSHQAPSNDGYGANQFGAPGGYGENRYQGQNEAAFQANKNIQANISNSGPSQPRKGGYGGFGPSNDRGDTDALFGDADKRYDPTKLQGSSAVDSSTKSSAPGDDYDGYGQPRELTQEEQEEVEYQSMRSEIKALKREDAGRAQNAANISDQAVQTMLGTMARLGEQDERLYNTEKNLDIAANHNRVAEENTKELKKYNQSMFAVHVSNPFTAKKRREDLDAKVLARHQADRETRETVRREAFRANQQHESNFKDVARGPHQRLAAASAAERSKYSLEDDSEDEQNEDSIDRNLAHLGQNMGTLNIGAKNITKVLDRQNETLDRNAAKSDAVDDGIMMNRGKLSRAAHGKS